MLRYQLLLLIKLFHKLLVQLPKPLFPILNKPLLHLTISRIRNAGFSEIIMTLRLIDSETGTLLWQASGRGSGYSLSDRLFGVAPKDDFSVAMDLLSELIETIY